MPPSGHHPDEFPDAPAPGQEHPEDLVPEDFLLGVEIRCDPKHTPPAKHAIAEKNVHVRMKAVISLMTDA